MFPIPTIYLVAAAIFVMAVAGGAIYYKGRADGQKAQLRATVEAYRKREGIDNEVHGMGDIALCIELGGLRDQCEQQLRGLAETHP